MRAVCQRVSEARVTVDGAVTGEIGAGVAVFVGIERTDEVRDARELARKVAQLRIFEDDRGKFAHSLLDTSGSRVWAFVGDGETGGDVAVAMPTSYERCQNSSIARTTARSSQHTQYKATTHGGFSVWPTASNRCLSHIPNA